MATEGAFGFFGLSSFHALCVHAFVFVGLSWLICIVLDVWSSVSDFGSLECLLGAVLLDVFGVLGAQSPEVVEEARVVRSRRSDKPFGVNST